ncbi:hypothetical protein ABT275_45325 [Streptomyces sp. NPDC001185]|uniref:hypothetical protein n=1 Tax=Streptomyces sp. NPDC001185 TaxID=3154380 RepID=UPI00331B4194
MANGIWHTGYGIIVHLSLPDLGHPDLPNLLAEITPLEERDRQLLECLEHHRDGVPGRRRGPHAVDGDTPTDGQRDHDSDRGPPPLRTTPTAEEPDRHKAMKQRIARTS